MKDKLNSPNFQFFALVFLGLLWIPFVFMTDFFPFYRFGMFAQSAKMGSPHSEKFLLRCSNKNFDTQEIRLSGSVFQALARKYYYQKNTDFLLKNIAQISPYPHQKWELWRWISPKDSICVALYESPKLPKK